MAEEEIQLAEVVVNVGVEEVAANVDQVDAQNNAGEEEEIFHDAMDGPAEPPQHTEWSIWIPHLLEGRLPTKPPTMLDFIWVFVSFGIFLAVFVIYETKPRSGEAEVPFSLAWIFGLLFQLTMLSFFTIIRPEMRCPHTRWMMVGRYALEFVAIYIVSFISRNVGKDTRVIWLFVLAAAYFLSVTKILLRGFDFWITIILASVGIEKSIQTKNVSLELGVGFFCFSMFAIRLVVTENMIKMPLKAMKVKSFREIPFNGLTAYVRQVQRQVRDMV